MVRKEHVGPDEWFRPCEKLGLFSLSPAVALPVLLPMCPFGIKYGIYLLLELETFYHEPSLEFTSAVLTTYSESTFYERLSSQVLFTQVLTESKC